MKRLRIKKNEHNQDGYATTVVALGEDEHTGLEDRMFVEEVREFSNEEAEKLLKKLPDILEEVEDEVTDLENGGNARGVVRSHRPTQDTAGEEEDTVSESGPAGN